MPKLNKGYLQGAWGNNRQKKKMENKKNKKLIRKSGEL